MPKHIGVKIQFWNGGIYKMSEEGTKYGYARVSTSDQSLDRQFDSLQKEGVPKYNIFYEKISGVKKHRPELEKLKAIVKNNDVVIVESLNRLGRSSADLLENMKYFCDRGVILISQKEQLDFSTAAGRLMTQLIAILSEFEHDLIIERTKEGVAAARRRGRIGGRPRVSQSAVNKAITMYEEGNLSVTDICKICEISKSTLMRYLKQHRQQKELDDEIDLDEF